MSIYGTDFFNHQHNGLVEQVPLARIAQQVGTPCYVYSTAALHTQWHAIQQACANIPDMSVAFALKACPELAVIRTLAQWGAGADVVSGGELYRALQAGVAAEKVVFSGCGKTDDELRAAIAANIGSINVESRNELLRINTLAQQQHKKVNVSLRVNPDVAAHTLSGIATGRRDDKFGIGMSAFSEAYAHACTLSQLNVRGVAVHIGSQLFDVQDYAVAYEKLAQLVHTLRAQHLPVHHLDLGGGFGSPYHARQSVFDWHAYVGVLQQHIVPLGVALTIEPGRFLTANAGALLTAVIDVKQEPDRQCITVVDAAMNDLLRPAMYGAKHHISQVSPAKGKKTRTAVVGGICESSDCFLPNALLSPCQAGDLLLIHSAGAYGFSMSSHYNTRPPAPAVLVDGDTFAVIRQRLTYQQMLQAELSSMTS